jgi:DNA polymerase III epsilon subunit-like protein
MTAWTDYRYAVVDVEGNGQQPPDLVEIGVVSIVDGVIGEPVSWLCKPARPITPMARRIHGISDDMVAAAPAFAELEAEVRAHLDEAVFVAHNAGVDLGVLRRKMPDFAPSTVLDTLKLSRRLLPDQVSYRLGSLVSALRLDDGLASGLRAHRVDYDVLVTARLFVHLASQPGGTPLSLEALREGRRAADDALF